MSNAIEDEYGDELTMIRGGNETVARLLSIVGDATQRLVDAENEARDLRGRLEAHEIFDEGGPGQRLVAAIDTLLAAVGIPPGTRYDRVVELRRRIEQGEMSALGEAAALREGTELAAELERNLIVVKADRDRAKVSVDVLHGIIRDIRAAVTVMVLEAELTPDACLGELIAAVLIRKPEPAAEVTVEEQTRIDLLAKLAALEAERDGMRTEVLKLRADIDNLRKRRGDLTGKLPLAVPGCRCACCNECRERQKRGES